MKSKLKSKLDLGSLNISNDLFKIEVPESLYEDEFNRLIKKHFILRDALESEMAVKDDFVMVTLQSSNSKYNKPIVPITLGLNMLNEQIEQSIIGMKIGELKTISIDDSEVNIQVKSIKKKSLIEVSDELVKKENIDNVSTIDEYKEYVAKQYKEKAKRRISMNLLSDVYDSINKTFEFDIDEQEKNDFIQSQVNSILKDAENVEGGIVTLVKGSNPEIETEAEAIENVKALIEPRFKLEIVAEEYCQAKGLIFNEETYEVFIEQNKDKIKTMENQSVKEAFTYETYTKYVMANSLNEYVINYFLG